jgi:hypothetical protein
MKKNWFWILIAVMILWQPLQPIRTVTADALDLAATWIRD